MWIQGYYPKYRYASTPPSVLPWDKLTHLALFSLAPVSDGTIVNTSGADIFPLIPDILETAHENGVKVLIVIGGANAAVDATWRTAVTTNKATFISNIVALVNNYGFDGVDIDWEPMNSSSDQADIVSFFADLRAALPSPKLITTFLASVTTWKWDLGNDIQGYVDKLGISTYDYSFGTTVTVHDSPLYHSGSQPTNKSIHEAMTNYIAAGVAPDKLLFSIPFFAQRWSGESALFDTATTGAFTAELYSLLPGASDDTEPTNAAYDATAKAAYVPTDPFTSFSSVQAVQDRVDYANAQGLGGILIWELGQAYFSGGTPTHPLMEPFDGEASVGDPQMVGIGSITGIASITL